METLERKYYPKGWTPCASEINGAPDGLLRADSLTLDEDGALTLVAGSRKVSSGAFAGNMRKIYARYMASKKLRYVFVDGAIYRNYGGAASLTNFDLGFLSGGSTTYAAFGTAFGQVLACSGTQKRMDDGTNQYNIGIAAPSAPGVSSNVPPAIDCQLLNAGAFTNWESLEGSAVTNSSNYFQFDADATTFRASAQIGRSPTVTLDTTNFAGTGTHTLDDIFKISVRVGDSTKLIKVRIEFLLQSPTAVSVNNDITDFLWYEWLAREPSTSENSEDAIFTSTFRQGINVWSNLVVKRSDFNRAGNDRSVDWNAVKGIRVIFTCTSATTCVFTDLTFNGGTTGPLNGYYQYKQVNVYNTGSFEMASLESAASSEVFAVNCSNQITPAAHAAPVNKKLYYRRGGKLAHWYLVKEITSSLNTAFADTLSDDDAILVNTKLVEGTSLLPDNILSMAGPYFNRMIYVTKNAIYPSIENDFSRYDPRQVIENCGSDAEINLFLARVSERELLIGSTVEIYSLSGDGTVLDANLGLLDFKLSGLGVNKPPISVDGFLVEDSSLIYLASDGWRKLAGSTAGIFSLPLDLLYRNQARFGIEGVLPLTSIPIGGASCCFSKGRFIACIEHNGPTGRILHVYNAKQNIWTLPYVGISGFTPFSVFCEEDGTVLCGTESGGDKYLRELFYGTQWDATTNLAVELRTVFDDFDKRYNRKESYTLKIAADTGNVAATIAAYKDGGTGSISLGALTFNGYEEKTVDISTLVGKFKSLQLKITGSFSTFKYYGHQVTATILPEQTKFLKLQPTNMGTQCRKRIFNFPIKIDTLGSNVTFKPFGDGAQITDASSVPASSVFNTSEAKTQTHWFDKDLLITDLGGTLAGTEYFEYYGPVIEEIVSEKLPPPVKYLVVPQTNFGTYAKKRFNRLSFVLNPRSGTVTVTPVLDGVAQTPATITGSDFKKTLSYFFASDTTAIEVGFIFSSSTVFEFYEILKPEIMEVFPEPARTLRTIPTNFGTYSRKRFNRIAFVMNTEGATATVTPYLDGVAQTPATFSSTSKKTLAYFFSSDVVAREVNLLITSGSDFYFYEMLKPELMEVLPEPVRTFRTPPNTFGSYNRKRFDNIPIVLDTLGSSVTITPYLDGVAGTSQTFSTSGKTVTSFFFTTTQTAREVSLLITGSSEFEFYDMLNPERMEILPAPTKNLVIPNSNYGVAAKKRIRTIPLVLDTRGSDIIYTPSVDGAALTASTFNTSGKRTVLHYFTESDGVLGIDFGGMLSGSSEFEFYEMLTPENVETLPVPKKFDQLGPIQWDRIGRAKFLGLNLLCTGISLTINFYVEDSLTHSIPLVTIANYQHEYEVQLPKGLNAAICRITLSSDNEFHRFSASLRFDTSGDGTKFKTVKFGN